MGSYKFEITFVGGTSVWHWGDGSGCRRTEGGRNLRALNKGRPLLSIWLALSSRLVLSIRLVSSSRLLLSRRMVLSSRLAGASR